MKRSNLFAKASAVALAMVTMFSTMTVAFAEEDSTVTDKSKVELIIEDQKGTKETDPKSFDYMIDRHNLISGTGNVRVAPADEMTISFKLNVDPSEIARVDIFKNENFYMNDGDKIEGVADLRDHIGWITSIYENGKFMFSCAVRDGIELDYEDVRFLEEENTFEINSTEWFRIKVTYQDNSSTHWCVVPENYEYKEYSLEEYINTWNSSVMTDSYYYKDDAGRIIDRKTDEPIDDEVLNKQKITNLKLVEEKDDVVDPSPDTSTIENHVVDLTKNGVVSSTDFAAILAENATKNVVIKSNNNVTFTFAKGTMKAVDGMTNYDFTTTINNTYKADLPSYVTKDNFVSIINYNYSGKLPAEASITIPVGKEYAGKTLYYSLMNEDKTFAKTQAVKVDAEGNMTVKQDHCSSYVITNVEPKIEEVKDSVTPNTGDNTSIVLVVAVGVLAMGAVVAGRKFKTA